MLVALRYQDQAVKATQKALDDVCRAALATPADKIDWKPMGDARSILDQMQEIATSAQRFIPILSEVEVSELDAAFQKEEDELRRSLDTLEKCIAFARASTARLCQTMQTIPDEMLEREVAAAFAGGATMTIADLIGLPAWNMIYHLGQINQIQLMLGDRKMH